MKRISGLSVVIILVAVLSGCQTGGSADVRQVPDKKQTVLAPSVRPVAYTTGSAAERSVASSDVSGSIGAAGNNNGLVICQNDLNSLRLVNDKSWKVRQKDFSALVAGASVYARVRADVNGKTRDTLDALYRYKTNQLCAQIERDVLDGLIVRGESIK